MNYTRTGCADELHVVLDWATIMCNFYVDRTKSYHYALDLFPKVM